MSKLFSFQPNVTNWILTQVSPEKIKPFDTSLPLIMTNDIVSLKFSNSVLMQKKYFSLYSNFILDLYIVYKLNNWPRNSINHFTRTNYLFGAVKLRTDADKSKFNYND